MLDNIDDTLQAAITAHEQQDFSNAINNYQTVLNGDPNHAEANHRFGILSIQLGQIESALIFLHTAINVNPNIHEYWVPFIDALIRLDRLSDAEIVLEDTLNRNDRIYPKDNIKSNLEIVNVDSKQEKNVYTNFADAINQKDKLIVPVKQTLEVVKTIDNCIEKSSFYNV